MQAHYWLILAVVAMLAYFIGHGFFAGYATTTP